MKEVLVVDDNDPVFKIIENELISINVRSIYASKNENALAELKKKKFRCIFLDIILGNESSAKVIDFLRSSENTLNQDIPVIVISGFADKDYSERIKCKVFSFLSKPFLKNSIKEAFLKLEKALQDAQENQFIEGELESNMDMEIIPGSGDEEKDINQVASEKTEEDNSSQVVKGETEEGGEFSNKISGTTDVITEGSQKVSGVIEEDDSVQLVKGSEEENYAPTQTADLADKAGVTGLMLSAETGDVMAYEIYLEEGANITLKSKDGRSLLHYAAWGGNVDIVKDLLEKRVNVNARNTEKEEPLLFAVQNNKVDVAKLLIEEGARVTSKDRDDKSYLMVAIEKNYIEMSELLLKNGSKISDRDKKGRNCLQQAENLKRKKIVALIKKR